MLKTHRKSKKGNTVRVHFPTVISAEYPVSSTAATPLGELETQLVPPGFRCPVTRGHATLHLTQGKKQGKKPQKL